MTVCLPPALPRLPHRESGGHKGDYGHVLVAGGSRGMAGSISLTASAALRGGAGLVTAAVPDRCLETVAGFEPCLMTVPLEDDADGRMAPSAADQLGAWIERVDVVACGPGMRRGEGPAAVVDFLVACDALPRVLDADGLNNLARHDDWVDRTHGPLVLTPHPGEFQRLSGAAASDRPGQIEAARRLAERSGAVILLKGSRSVVTDGRRCYENETGNPGMATGGTGDVLTGLIAALLGQGLDPWEAATLGVFAHGLAGDLAAAAQGQAGMTARDLLERIPEALKQIQ